MSTIAVWVLVFYMTNGSYQGGPGIIDNISSMEECERVRKVLESTRLPQTKGARCIEVIKRK